MNILSNQQQETLLLQFPKNIKLSYEKVIHNKVYECVNQDTILMAIPKGRKAFFWFHQGNIYLMKLSMNGGNQIESVQKMNEFDSLFSELNGSVFYGTLTFLSQVKKQLISIEDVFYYKNENVSHRFFIDKLNWIHELLQLTNQCSSRMVWGLPILRKTQQDILAKIQEVQDQMTIYCILIRSWKENKPSSKIIYANFLEKKIENPQKEKSVETLEQNQSSKKDNLFKINLNQTTTKNLIQTKTFPKMKFFNVKADLQNDIYHLYEDEKYIDVAYIPDYKTSVMMNRLFRNIKENENLDALEESDDEEEFENDKEDRFVDLNKVLKMQCYFHPKFKRWTVG